MVQVFGVRLIGVSWENLHKLLLTLGFVASALLIRHGVLWVLRHLARHHGSDRLWFWSRQSTSVFAGLLIVLAVISIWFDDPARLATPLGLVSAGVAFALQRAITAGAGYLVILRGKTFRVGDRIVMGGVRGDVIALGFIQTTILEMGEQPTEQKDGPAQWVQARQYTGRVVTVTNDKIFDAPVYNYTREFPFIWDEIHVPVSYKCDRDAAERILLEAAHAETEDVRSTAHQDLDRLRRRYFVEINAEEPHVYWRITDNWLELTVRFVCRPYDVRGLKDRMSRRILAAFDEAGIGIASTTYDVVGLPPLQIEGATAQGPSAGARDGGSARGATPTAKQPTR
jgi:small-conductance mechanosensitive channel